MAKAWRSRNDDSLLCRSSDLDRDWLSCIRVAQGKFVDAADQPGPMSMTCRTLQWDVVLRVISARRRYRLVCSALQKDSGDGFEENCNVVP